jgi:hypothetical protein
MIFVVLGKRALNVLMDSNGVNVLPLLKFSDGANAMMACVTDDTRSLDGRLEMCHLYHTCWLDTLDSIRLDEEDTWLTYWSTYMTFLSAAAWAARKLATARYFMMLDLYQSIY